MRWWPQAALGLLELYDRSRLNGERINHKRLHGCIAP